MVERPAAGGHRPGTKALDDYYWSSEFRLSDSARHMQYGRVLGVPGGEVSTEVQPNTQLNDLWMRFIASLAEYDRQQRVSDIVSGQRTSALSLTGEAGPAGRAQPGGERVALRLGRHAVRGPAPRQAGATSFAILNNKEIQAAYGVDGPYKVIERVTTEQWGAAPNIVKYRAARRGRGRRSSTSLAKHASDLVRDGRSRCSTTRRDTSQTRSRDGFQALVTALGNLAGQNGGRGIDARRTCRRRDRGRSTGGHVDRSSDRGVRVGHLRQRSGHAPARGRQRHRRPGHQGRHRS